MNEVNIGPLYINEVGASAQTMGWQIDNYDLPVIWNETKGAGIKVAVLDTGVDADHIDLSLAANIDFVSGAMGIPLNANYVPVHGHGTHVSGIIGAKDNGDGVVGVAPDCEIYACRVLGEDGSGNWNDISRAIDWCIDNDIDVINMSLGGNASDETAYHVIRRAYEAGVVVVCAGGNNGWSWGYNDFPATYNETIAVASINSNMDRSSFSSVGSNIDIAAPGENIISTTPNNTYSNYSGTSMATPFVAGIIALIMSKHKTLGGGTPIECVEDVRDHLIKTATDAGYEGKDYLFGNGLINPAGIMASVNEEIRLGEEILAEKEAIAAREDLERRAEESIKPDTAQYTKDGNRIYGGGLMGWNDKPWEM